MVLKTQNLEMLKVIDTNHSINSDIIFEHCKHKFCASSHTKCKYVYETLYISSKRQFENINVDEFLNQLLDRQNHLNCIFEIKWLRYSEQNGM